MTISSTILGSTGQFGGLVTYKYCINNYSYEKHDRGYPSQIRIAIYDFNYCDS